MIKFNNLNNLNEYLKKSEAEKIYMKKINSLNISFTELLTLITQTFSIYDREIEGIKNNTYQIHLDTTSIYDDLSSFKTFINSELSTIKIDTLNLYNMITSGGGGEESYNYMKQLNKISADTYINFDNSYIIDDVEKFTYNDNINVRTSDTNKLSFVIQSNISNTGLNLSQNIDRLGVKFINNIPINGNVKSLDLVACNSDAGADISNVVCSSIKFINSNSGYFTSLNLPEYTTKFDFSGYTMNTSYGLNLYADTNQHTFFNMKNLNVKFNCNITNKYQYFSACDSCNFTFTQNNRLAVTPYVDDTKYFNTIILESLNNSRLFSPSFGNGQIFNYNDNFTLSSMFINGKTWTLKNFNNDVLNLNYCSMYGGTIENYNTNDITLLVKSCTNNFHLLNIYNFPNIILSSVKGYSGRDTNYLNLYGVRDFTFKSLTEPSLHLQGTLSKNDKTINGSFSHLAVDLNANGHTVYFGNYTAGDINLTLNNINASGLTNPLINITGNNCGIIGGNHTSLNFSGVIGLSNINVNDLNITINSNDYNNLTFKPYENVNITNMSFNDDGGYYFKGMLKLNNPFNNVYGLNVSNNNFNEGINDPDVSLLNSGIIQNINYGITSINLSFYNNKVINANWICNCDNVKLINVCGLNPSNILFDTNNYMFENICKANTDSNEVFTIWCDSVYSSDWNNLINNSKIKPFTYEASKNMVYLFY